MGYVSGLGQGRLDRHQNSTLLPDLLFSDGVKSPQPRILDLSNNNFIQNKNPDQSIYDVFRRSKHRLYEIEKNKILLKKEQEEMVKPSKIRIDKKSLFLKFKQHQKKMKLENILPSVIKKLNN